MTPIRIIGIGSPFGDDRLGWEAVEAIRRSGLLEYFPQGLVSVQSCDRPASGLLMLMEGAAHVILIDAMRSGAVPGKILRLQDEEIEMESALLSSHGFGVAESLALGGALGMLPARLVLYGVEVRDLDQCDTLTPETTGALPMLVERIKEELFPTSMAVCVGKPGMYAS
ncbi:MAG: hydrogenase maturation protease [Gammaproteobacteria bacterium]|nr:hydrogenase maturation protease [Gammaproteobacteria bacterium]